MRKKYIIFLAFIVLIAGCSEKNNNKHIIVIYGDYKCPYCKKVEHNIMPKLQKNYIDKGKVDYQFVNMAFLGKDSIKGSRAGHAVENIAPKQYLEFQKLMFSEQPNHENEWITEKLIDEQIVKLHLSKQKTYKIKKEYKTKGSQAWKDAEKDQEKVKKNNIEEAPTVYIDGKKLDNPYDYKEYKKDLR
ncbi:protein-disulfide isomerase [Staphylococcus epidermidis]|uniref:DsbA family protein n=1 Tax=Staphylococcus epidermidis TaxID=1282 RepID=UPI0007E46050|nr:DsbA family protein [Staphylococcus epidermidis]OAW56905.1 protein-disulfide isomerase [Staphylococcus epidermidis]